MCCHMAVFILALDIGPSRSIFGGLTLQSTTVEGKDGPFVFPETIKSSSLPKDFLTNILGETNETRN